MGIVMMLQWRNRDSMNYLEPNLGGLLESVYHKAPAYLHFVVCSGRGLALSGNSLPEFVGPDCRDVTL
jgi:hypothetical protein